MLRLKHFSVLLLLIGFYSSADAAVLCSNPSGAVFVRADSCRSGEALVDPVALGLRGPQGDAGTAGPTSLVGGLARLITEQGITLASHTITGQQAGLNLIFAAIAVTDIDPTTGGVTSITCYIAVNGGGTAELFSLHDNGESVFKPDMEKGTLLARQTLNTGDVVEVKCATDIADSNEAVGAVQLLIARVAS